jgi:hypothetical protein
MSILLSVTKSVCYNRKSFNGNYSQEDSLVKP